MERARRKNRFRAFRPLTLFWLNFLQNLALEGICRVQKKGTCMNPRTAMIMQPNVEPPTASRVVTQLRVERLW